MKKRIRKFAAMSAGIIGFALVIALSLPVYSASAQSDGNKTETVRPHEGNPFMSVLDADKDGVLSAEEIENAGTALKSLDKNGDGKLTRDELPRKKGKRVKGSEDTVKNEE